MNLPRTRNFAHDEAERAWKERVARWSWHP
jgi:hypothetical protein